MPYKGVRDDSVSGSRLSNSIVLDRRVAKIDVLYSSESESSVFDRTT